MGRLVKEYHWAEVNNFGDAMAPLLLARFADLKTERDTISRASIVTVGSVLEHVPPEWDGAILGAGKLRSRNRTFQFYRLCEGVGVLQQMDHSIVTQRGKVCGIREMAA